MDSIIKELIKIDAAAEEKVSAAKTRLKAARELLESEKEAVEKSHRAMLEGQIKKADKAAAREFDRKSGELEKEFNEIRGRLEESFLKNREIWADEIAGRLTAD